MAIDGFIVKTYLILLPALMPECVIHALVPE
jgi:hypothetical protein